MNLLPKVVFRRISDNLFEDEKHCHCSHKKDWKFSAIKDKKNYADKFHLI